MPKQTRQFCLGGLGVAGVPDGAPLRADALANGQGGGVMGGVLGQMELAALPGGAAEDRPCGRRG